MKIEVFVNLEEFLEYGLGDALSHIEWCPRPQEMCL